MEVVFITTSELINICEVCYVSNKSNCTNKSCAKNDFFKFFCLLNWNYLQTDDFLSSPHYFSWNKEGLHWSFLGLHHGIPHWHPNNAPWHQPSDHLAPSNDPCRRSSDRQAPSSDPRPHTGPTARQSRARANPYIVQLQRLQLDYMCSTVMLPNTCNFNGKVSDK
jgi:hypothetical protein